MRRWHSGCIPIRKSLGGRPPESIEAERAVLERHTERLWEKLDHGLMAVFLKSDDSFVGICGLLRWEIDAVAETEVAYASCRRRGETGMRPKPPLRLQTMHLRGSAASALSR